MAKILYLDFSDCRNKSGVLQRKLRKSNLEFDFVEDFQRTPGDISSQAAANKTFQETYFPKLGDYDVLIAHGGIVFDGQVPNIRRACPPLAIMLISDFGNSIDYIDGRSGVCRYSSPYLIPFVKEHLKIPNKSKTNKK